MEEKSDELRDGTTLDKLALKTKGTPIIGPRTMNLSTKLTPSGYTFFYRMY